MANLPDIGQIFLFLDGHYLGFFPFLADAMKDVLVHDAVLIISALGAKIGHAIGPRRQKAKPPHIDALVPENDAVAHFINGLRMATRAFVVRHK